MLRRNELRCANEGQGTSPFFTLQNRPYDGTMSEKFEIDDGTAFYGRTFAEYSRMFDLDWSRLDGEAVLDSPGGPGSFTAVASAVAASVTAVDPCYGAAAETLARQCEERIEQTAKQLRDRRDAFVWDEYGDVETRVRFVRTAAARFLADYERAPRRYVAAALPKLPFDRDTFDLVLSANLLFLYDDRFDRSFHVRALQELARVARAEVRVFPLADLAAERSGYVQPAVQALREDGLAVETQSVPYEFQPGVSEMLVVSDVDGYEPA